MNLNHDEILRIIKKQRLVAILRGVPMHRLDGIVRALIAGGVRVLEFTFDHDREHYMQENAEKIAYAVEHFGDRVIVGCGTALSVQEVQAAYDAGARLVISPDTNVEVIRKTRELGMVSMPGALTPSEIVVAWNAGADVVKLFPAGELGLGFIKAVRGPLGYIPMSAVGGASPETVRDYLNAGVCGFGVGSPIVSKEAVLSGDDADIEARARRFTTAIAAWEAEQCAR